jgi:hypothetical protein
MRWCPSISDLNGCSLYKAGKDLRANTRWIDSIWSEYQGVNAVDRDGFLRWRSLHRHDVCRSLLIANE